MNGIEFVARTENVEVLDDELRSHSCPHFHLQGPRERKNEEMAAAAADHDDNDHHHGLFAEER